MACSCNAADHTVSVGVVNYLKSHFNVNFKNKTHLTITLNFTNLLADNAGSLLPIKEEQILQTSIVYKDLPAVFF